MNNKKLKLQIDALEKAADSSAAVDAAIEQADRMVDNKLIEDRSEAYINTVFSLLKLYPEEILGVSIDDPNALPKTNTPREPTDEEQDQFLAAAGGDEVKALELIKQNGFL